VVSSRLVRVGAVFGVVGLTAGAWFAGRQVRSPAQVAANAKPPVASRITAPVEQRVLESSIIVRGLVRYGDPRAVVLPSSAVKSTTAGLIVSSPATKGAELADGAVALVVGGRPVFVLEGKTPAYRDMRPGDFGDDVQQLESALSRLGFSPGAADGRYDSATESAVERWYQKAGFDAFGPTDAQRTQLRSARDAQSKAADAVESAKRTLETAQRGVSNDKILSAEEQVRAANEKLVSAQEEATKSKERVTAELATKESAVTLAQGNLDLAQKGLEKAKRDVADTVPVVDAQDAVASAESALLQAKASLDEANAQVPVAEAALTDARTNVETAKKDLESAKKTYPTTISQDGVILGQDNAVQIRQAEGTVRQAESAARNSESSLASAQRLVETRKTNVADAERALEKARGGIDRAKQSVGDRSTQVSDAQQKVTSAAADLDRAQRELATTRASIESTERTNSASARQAAAGVKIAKAQLEELRKPAEVATARSQLRSAENSEVRAAAELTDLESDIGVVTPANELLFFPSLPLRVDEVKADRGDVVNGAVMTVTTSRLAVDSSVDTVEAKQIKVGSPATIESSEFDVELKGTVTEIAATPGTKGADPSKVYVEVTPDGNATSGVNAADLNGSSVKLTIPVSSTRGEVLAVPVAGVSVASDGTSRVEIEEDPGRPTRFVTVRTGLSAEGFVEVTAVKGAIKAGDQVVVGNRDGSAIEGSAGPEDQGSDDGEDILSSNSDATQDGEATSEEGNPTDTSDGASGLRDNSDSAQETDAGSVSNTGGS
jgi:multidrug efflux pump subunit AcrA (membrane-fusion protein)